MRDKSRLLYAHVCDTFPNVSFRYIMYLSLYHQYKFSYMKQCHTIDMCNNKGDVYMVARNVCDKAQAREIIDTIESMKVVLV